MNQQSIFLETLKKYLPESISFPSWVADTLNISLDSAYRRMRAETILSFDEGLILMQAAKIHPAMVFPASPNVVSFMVGSLSNTRQSFNEYMERLTQDLSLLGSAPDNSVIYAAEDIPLFYHFYSKALCYFKLFYWMKGIQGVQDLPAEVYSVDMFGDFFEKKATLIFKQYAQVNTTEIWTDETIQSTLSQIRFYWDSGLIPNPNDAVQILNELSEVVQLIKSQSEQSERLFANEAPTGKEYVLYISDLMIGTNTVLLHVNNQTISYLSYNTFNSMKTNNPHFNQQTNAWLQNLISKSTLASGVGEKYRHIFFKNMFQKIDQLREYILS